MNESKKSPAIAAVLNFLFWGLGYVYVDEPLGAALVFYNVILAFLFISISLTSNYISDVKTIFYNFGAFEAALSSSLFIISIIFAWHAYEMAKEKNYQSFSVSTSTRW
ncbi:MAG TPA: hypothetical protein VIO58_15570 [Candidatus Methanoperedens sp.]